MKRWLKNAKVASAIGFLILIALIWFVGPWMGLVSAEARFGWIFGVMLLWVLTLLVGQMLANRAGGLIEKMLQRQADDAVMGASPDKRAEVNLLRQRLLGAIDTLKSSKIGKARGNAALYELPWYMIIGHPAAGKSSAILQSGLTFPFSDKAGVQGVGGTRNCDWFFSTEGVLLDTAGRYATQTEDRVEWLEFLKLLKRHRAKAPVNGILVAISLPELAQHKSEGFAIYARQIRERIHEIEDIFGLQVPIYLVFTKIDLLGGFAQFFEDVPEDERNKVWGATLTHDQGAGFNIGRVVGQHFDTLYRGLRQLGEDKLAAHRGNASRAALFAFPIEFHALQEAICHFVELLHEEDPYHARPLLRGFYFSSALQEGVPRIGAATRVSGQFDLGRSGFDARQAPASYSYFLRDLFREVLFPDQHLISRQTRPSGSRWRLAGMLGGLALLALVASALTWSFIGNQKMIAAIEAERAQAGRLVESGPLYERLKGLALLQKRLEDLQHYRTEGHPWQIGMGLYQGDKLEQSLRKQYFEGVRLVMLDPVKANLEAALVQLAQAGPGQERPAPPAADTGESDDGAARSRTPSRPRRPDSGLPVIPLSRADTGGFMRVGYAAGLRRAQPAVRQMTQALQPEPPKAAPQTLDAGYNALKTYLMLNQQQRMEQAHLSDQLPRYWRPWLEQHRGAHSIEEINVLAERLVAFYISQLKAPDLPLIDNKEHVVAGARDTLRGSLTRLSAKERVYNELKARANTRFAPLSVARILGGRDGNIIAGSAMVPGAFTREAWEKYLGEAIVEASRGEIKSDDWVLASSIQDNLGKGADVDKNRQELEALYRADYAEAWRKFLQGVAIAEQANLAQAAEATARLADRQNSPIKLVLLRAAYETAWDNPSELHKKLENAKKSVIDKTAEIFKGGDAPAAAQGQYGQLGQQFAVLAAVAGSNSQESPLMAGYLEQLAKLKAKLSQLAGNDDPATASRQLMQATLGGSGSEFADTLLYVDNNMLGSADAASKEMLRPLLVRPLLQSYAALMPPVEQDLNLAWQREVYGQWRTLASKYPFSDAQNEAPLSEIARFVKPNDGTLDKFIDKYLNGLVLKRGGQLVPRTWGNQGVRFNPAFLAGAGRLSALGGNLLQEGSDNSRFELQPVPTPGLSEITVEIDGQTLRYRNGPQPWQAFSWPGTTGSQGARIQVVAFNGVSTVVANQPGRMGFMRLLGQARVNDSEMNAGQLEWRMKSGNQESDAVRVNFRMVSGVNPLQLSGLRRLGLPERITQ
ncbi:type VI secretion system membrane subunit TssM [Chitiniphilus purpureus]|uniref:Type VI secretion system membrane subunit TssM n=1 Tax=Chitiniphilus purpureus TaxID=2981137 RepID=A0ABY6DN84_9NEIS|nr:type VI secretion system membrane subunit TssM [Chitiniphilus sp. CD1]UXY14571.1 type VI secretion system membrane subunit TssM [Chitiniphilus sp. CD1]